MMYKAEIKFKGSIPEFFKEEDKLLSVKHFLIFNMKFWPKPFEIIKLPYPFKNHAFKFTSSGYSKETDTVFYNFEYIHLEGKFNHEEKSAY